MSDGNRADPGTIAKKNKSEDGPRFKRSDFTGPGFSRPNL